MSRYLRDRAREIQLDRVRGKSPEAEANESEISAMRGLNGKISWVAREGMPQGSGDASILASKMPKPQVKDLQEANAALRRLLAHDIPITICPIPLERLRLAVFADANLGNAGRGKPLLIWFARSTSRSLRVRMLRSVY